MSLPNFGVLARYAQASAFLCSSLAIQHRDRGQEIVASGSQISGKDRVRGVGDIGDTHPLLLVLDVGVENLNPPTQIIDERPQFRRAGLPFACATSVGAATKNKFVGTSEQIVTDVL